MEKLEGFVERIVFRNETNGYTVLSLSTKDDEDVTCVGVFSIVKEGEYLEMDGEYLEHPVYGPQFSMKSYDLKEPQDTIAVERYLGSGAIKGVGVALAKRIVARFKEDTFRIMEEEPERLSEVKGISARKAREIADQIVAVRSQRQTIMFLQEYGIGMTMSVKLYQQYGSRIYDIIQNNPYQLAEDVDGIGFKTADEIARKSGILRDSEFRIQSGILYSLILAGQDGHTCLPQEEVTSRAAQVLDIEEALIEEQYMNLVMDRKISCERRNDRVFVYANVFFHMERNTAIMLDALDVSYDIDDVEIERTIRAIERETSMPLEEMQAEAVKEAVKNGLMILTGGPGTGKTTTINAIIHYYEKEGLDTCLAAPTGRAAKRMTETTGCVAKTIHRMLEVSGGPDGAKGGFERNENNPLETDVIIIDEMSMVDITLMYALLKAIIPGTRVILVGDVDQLPSVGPGNVLKDIISSKRYATVKLSHIFRQSESSHIIVNAHKINKGEEVLLDNKSRDFFFLERADHTNIINVMIQLVYQKLPPYVDATPYDIQVLTPMRKGALGVENLNRVLQRYLNPEAKDKKEITFGDHVFRQGDKVMQTKNNYQLEWEVRGRYGTVREQGLGIFNGDMGIIQDINSYGEYLTIAFDDDHIVEYSFKLLEELDLAYAITIHKSQGSEYPAVVIPLLGGPKMLMNRNLLYTAVSRAKKCVTLVGSKQTFYEMEGNTMEQKRYSGLAHQIELLKEEEIKL